MTFLVASSSPLAGKFVVKKYAGWGILGSDISTSGDSGGSPLANDTLDPGGEYYWRLETPPSSGTVTIYPDVTFTHTGAADGVWTWQYRAFKTGVDQGVATVTDTFGAAAISLVIASALHAHIADNLTLGTTDSTSLSVQDSMHAHTADGVSLSAAAYLAIADALHAHIADSLTLGTSDSTSLSVQEATHAHTADGLTLSTAAYLAIAEASHAHSADNAALSTTAYLAVADALHAHSTDNVDLSTTAYLAIAEAVHAHLADNLGLSTAGSASLSISDALHGHSADGIALTLDSLLSISESIHAHFADALVLSIPSAPGSYPTAVEIAAAILAAAQITPIHANVKQMNDEQMIGNGSTGNKWRSHLVP